MKSYLQKTGYRVAIFCTLAFVAGLLARLAQDGIVNYLSERPVEWNGGKFKGTMNDGVPDGEGQFTKDGITVEGQWTNGEITYGTISSFDYSYEGGIQDLKFHGYGVCHYSDGHTFKGFWNQGIKDGLGLIEHADGKMNFAYYEAD